MNTIPNEGNKYFSKCHFGPACSLDWVRQNIKSGPLVSAAFGYLYYKTEFTHEHWRFTPSNP